MVIESTSHLFFECRAFSKVWMDMAKWLGVSVVYHNNCNSRLNYFSGVSIGGKGAELGLRTIWFAC